MSDSEETAFPLLIQAELALVREQATLRTYQDGELVFSVGDNHINLFVVESGEIEIQNPADDHRVIATHPRYAFAGDIDLLTGRPVIVDAVARGETQLLVVPHGKINGLLNRVPSLGEKLIRAFLARREQLMKSDKVGLQIIGPQHCRHTNLACEFLYKNFVPFHWNEPTSESGMRGLERCGDNKTLPLVVLGNGQLLHEPTLAELAQATGISHRIAGEHVQLAIIGAGPAGIAASVYAASEGIQTLLIDRIGPGGQAGGSSKIENFIGFPSGLSGAELAARGVLQLLKFGGRIVAPFNVRSIERSSYNQPFHLGFESDQSITADVVLIATGVNWRRLLAKDAERFEGAGLHYVCTVVESHLYDGQDVAVVGGGNSAGQAAMFLSECCDDRCVHLIVRSSLGPGMSDYLLRRIEASSRIKLHCETEIIEMKGDAGLQEIVCRQANHEDFTLPCHGVFAFIGAEPSGHWLPAPIARDAAGYLLTGGDAAHSGHWPLTDRQPCVLETSMPGVLAAGDIRSGSTKRVGFAVGDGSLAVTCTHRLLAELQRV